MKTETAFKKNQKLYVSARVKRLQSRLKEKQLNAFLVSAGSNRFYLTLWQGDDESGFLLITPQEKYLITDSRYTEHATNLTDFQIIESNDGIGPVLAKLAVLHKLKRIGFESHDVSVFTIGRLRKFLKGIKLVPVAHFVEEFRRTKDEAEISNLKKASLITDKAFTHILKFIKAGRTEAEIAWEMERYMRGLGAEKMAWEPFIVATGKNASMAHWGASGAKLKRGDMVQLDYGCVFGGYACDMSRVVFLGSPDKKQKEIYNLVVKAQQIGLSLVKRGVEASKIDRKVHEFIENNLPGWLKPEYIYKHSLGHGVGIDVHELPYVSEKRKNRLEEGNMITIEPGIYVPGWGGVRIEDTVLVTKTGYTNLTRATKKITDVII